MLFECVLSQKKTNNQFWGLTISLAKSQFLLDVKKHTFHRRKSTNNLLRSGSHTTTTKVQTGCTHLCWVTFKRTSSGRRGWAAQMRRERGLRAWHRHIRTTVAVVLVTAFLHHSAQEWWRGQVRERCTRRTKFHGGTSPGDGGGASA